MEIGLKQRGTVVIIPAVIDTGFSGHVCLSEQHIDKLTMDFHHVERYELANGEVVATPAQEKDLIRVLGLRLLSGFNRRITDEIISGEETGASTLPVSCLLFPASLRTPGHSNP